MKVFSYPASQVEFEEELEDEEEELEDEEDEEGEF